MKHTFQPLALILLLAAAGCASTGGPGAGYQNINAFTARYLDVQEKRMEPARIQPQNIFMHTDMVAAVVRNFTYQDQLVIVEFLRADTGEAVYKKTIEVKAERMAYTAPVKPLPAGEYHLKVTTNRMPPFMQAFSVRGF